MQFPGHLWGDGKLLEMSCLHLHYDINTVCTGNVSKKYGTKYVGTNIIDKFLDKIEVCGKSW